MTAPQCSLNLLRHPYSPKAPLQAWDAADSYLLNLLEDSHQNLTLVNDSFGALTLNLWPRVQQSWSDSALSAIACRSNAQRNGLDAEALMGCWVPMAEDIAPPEGIILLKVPKSMALLQWQLQWLSACAPPGAELWLGGMDKHLTKHQFDAVAAHFGPVVALKGWKKARVWQATNAKAGQRPERFSPGYPLPGSSLLLEQSPGIFCGHQLDIGSRFLLEHLDQIPQARRVADLGCGNGVLGLSYLLRYPDTEMVMTDESSMAVACAQRNLQALAGSGSPSRAVLSDGMPGDSDQAFDLILCNPPFHQGTTVTTELANDLFQSAKDSLRDGGQMWVVANRHLQYHVLLKNIFGRCTTVSGDSKFVILMVQKTEKEA